MRGMKLAHFVERYVPVILGQNVLERTKEKRVRILNRHKGESNPDFYITADGVALDFGLFSVDIIKSKFNIWLDDGHVASESLRNEILLSIAEVLEVRMGVPLNTERSDGARHTFMEQDRNCDEKITTKIYWPYRMEEFGPQDQDLRAIKMLQFMRPFLVDAINVAQAAVRRNRIKAK